MNQQELICPVCREALRLENRVYSCNNNHSFDVAKDGYVNLLLTHQRKSKNPGDDKAMIQARRRFFDSGAFDPLAKHLKRVLKPRITDSNGSQQQNPAPHPSILDCGCGEGHLLGTLSGNRFGVDVSKEAIRYAAKRHKEITWIVANGMRELPFANDSMDHILSILAPRNNEEFARVLKPGGTLILGVPGPKHLIELRSKLTDHASAFEEKADEAAGKCASHFREMIRETFTYPQTLNQTQILDLIQMTPLFWNSSPEAKEKIRQIEELTITISFALIHFTCSPS